MNASWKKYEKKRLAAWKTAQSGEALVCSFAQAVVDYREHVDLAMVLDNRLGVIQKMRSRDKIVRILVLFSGTGSVESAISTAFPRTEIVTLDSEPNTDAVHVSTL